MINNTKNWLSNKETKSPELIQCEQDMQRVMVNSDLSLVSDALMQIGCDEVAIKSTLKRVANVKRDQIYKFGNIEMSF